MSASQQVLYGRAWRLTVTTTTKVITVSSGAWDPEALRITFEVNLAVNVKAWSAKIVVYNATSELMSEVLTQGQTVKLEAGYQTQPYGTIFEGQIYQPTWERKGGTDYALTLLCYTSLKETIGNFSSSSGIRGQTQADLIASMCANAHTPITVGKISTQALSDAKLPRARAFFGDPRTFINGVAKGNLVQAWFGFDGLNLKDYFNNDQTPTITYTPTTGLVGTPAQTQDGVEFTVLLDARLVITGKANLVKLDMSQIRQLERPNPLLSGQYQPLFSSDGIYIVIAVDFIGDSRGNDWYAHVVAVTSIGGKAAMLTDALISSSNGDIPKLDPNAPR